MTEAQERGRYNPRMAFMDLVRDRVRGRGVRIVLAEGDEPRAQRAASILAADGLAGPILLGAEVRIRAAARAASLPFDGVEVRQPRDDPRRAFYAGIYAELRSHKGVSLEAAQARVAEPHYFAASMVKAGDADGFVSGLRSETKPFLPAFEIVKMREGFRRASSVFMMIWPNRVLLYADCSVNIAPDAATLSEIGRATAATARSFGIEPREAFLSFSTHGSATDESVDRVREATLLARSAEPGLIVDGELQFDAACVPEVARRKCPDSPLRGDANVLVFPNLDAGNLAYKITERLAGARAVGPILQGLRQPVNDVSRGCSAEDLADVAVITAAQVPAASTAR